MGIKDKRNTHKEEKKNVADEQVWKSIAVANNGSNLDVDEIYFMKLLARNIAQHEDFYNQIKKNCRSGMIVAISFGVSGMLCMIITMLIVGGTTEISLPFLVIKPTTLDGGCLCFFACIIVVFEILAGLGVWLHLSSVRQLGCYHDTVNKNQHILLLVGLAAKTKESDKNTDKELYARIIESELRRREQSINLQKEENRRKHFAD